MNKRIVDVINNLFDFTWIEKKGGIVTPVKLETEKGIFIYPILENESPDECEPGQFIDFVPDSNKHSILYWEGLNNDVTERKAGKIKFNSGARLVFWYNRKYFNGADNFQLIALLLSKIPHGISVEGYRGPVLVKFINEEVKSSAIFARYTYKENTQFLIPPYDYFALNFTFTGEFAPGCFTDIELQEIEC